MHRAWLLNLNSCGTRSNNVRFIAVSEGYDSLTASSSETHTIIPFRNLLNEQYNGDTSIKVRTSQGILRRNGLFIGAFAPYGYKKAEDNKNHLVPDPYAAGVVQGIFAKKLSGMSASGIAKILNSMAKWMCCEFLIITAWDHIISFL